MHTDGTTNGYHLQVASFEPPCKRRVCGVCGCSLWVEHVAIRPTVCLWRHSHGHGKVGVPFEAVEDTAAQSLVVPGRFAIVVGSLGRSSEALFGSVHVVVHGRQRSWLEQQQQDKGRPSAEKFCTWLRVAARIQMDCFFPPGEWGRGRVMTARGILLTTRVDKPNLKRGLEKWKRAGQGQGGQRGGPSMPGEVGRPGCGGWVGWSGLVAVILASMWIDSNSMMQARDRSTSLVRHNVMAILLSLHST